MRLMLSIVAALLAAAPAHAADLATIDCIAGKIEIPIKALLAIDVERNLTEQGKPARYEPRVLAAVNAGAAQCAKEHGWPEAALQPARLYAIATIGWPTAQKFATDKGFDMGALEEAWSALPEETRNQPLPPTEYQALIRGFITDEAKQTRENAELIKQCIGFLSTIQYSSYQFSQA